MLPRDFFQSLGVVLVQTVTGVEASHVSAEGEAVKCPRCGRDASGVGDCRSELEWFQCGPCQNVWAVRLTRATAPLSNTSWHRTEESAA